MKHYLIALLFLLPSLSRAELSVPHFFSDHMVLQRNTDAALWGTTSPDTEVTLTFGEESVSTTADEAGKWRIAVPTGEANARGRDLVISADGEKLTLSDVLVGEVWFASGQSNMVMTMNRIPDYENLIAKSDHPGIRMFNAPMVTALEPQTDIEGEWSICAPDTVPLYSATAFFFGRKLHSELEIPIGIIKSAWGGKPVETFTSRKALKTLPGTKRLVDAAVERDSLYVEADAVAAYQKRLTNWNETVAASKKLPKEERKKLPKKPQPPKRYLETEGQPGVLFNSMINPFAGYTMRGAIWYQGEANAKPGAVPYDKTLPLLIRDWRARWDHDFSFNFVQLANFKTATSEPGDNDQWPLLQDRMRRILDTTPKTGMAIINDIGEAKDIHPKNKKDVGERLALWALAKDYGRDIVYSGPLYLSHQINKGKIQVKFDHVGDGLKARDGKALQRFEIAGKDKTWRWAEAEISDTDTVTLSHPDIAKPKAARYAWAANPDGANLVNSEGLPASVFRTDDWDDVIEVVDNSAAEALEARRALATEIKNLGAKRNEFERNSKEWKSLNEKRSSLLEKFRETAPGK
ncbi:MAG: hypothetical protein P1U68_04715 [Verrucomicrobiales bacterium]|nr:hypothetical protein [Verrucomicrobiales bacterium]